MAKTLEEALVEVRVGFKQLRETMPPAPPATPSIMKITPDDVGDVYTGKPGCMCGCRGNYWSHPAHAGDSGGPHKPSLKMVHKVLNHLKANAAEVEADPNGGIFSHETPSRNIVLYLKKSK